LTGTVRLPLLAAVRSASDAGRARVPMRGLMTLRLGGELATLDPEPMTLGVKRTEGADLGLVSVGVTSDAMSSSSDPIEAAEATVVAWVLVERSEDSETDSVSGSCSW